MARSCLGRNSTLLGGSVLNYVGHRACIHKASQSARLSKRVVDLSELFKRQEQAGGQEKNRLHRATRNGSWLSAVPHHLSGTGLSWEEFRDNLCIRYGLMPQDIPATCDGCGKKFVPSAITYEPKINSRTVQGERTEAGARQEGGEADGGT